MQQQPLVMRGCYQTEAEANNAHEELENIGVFGDVAAPDKTCKHWRVVYVDINLNLARNSLRRIQTRPFLVEVFLPENSWTDEFKTVQL